MNSRVFTADFLRATAIFSVVLYHLYPQSFTIGRLGVELFLVLSGYLISQMVSSGKFEPRLFLIRRVRRIIHPTLWVVTVSLSIFCIFFDELFSKILIRDGLSAVVGLSNVNFFLKNSYFSGNALENPYIHFWSIGLEVQFYIFIAFVYGLFGRTAFNILTLFSVISFFIWLVLPFKSNHAFYILDARLWMFYFGFLAHYISKNIPVSFIFSVAVFLTSLIATSFVGDTRISTFIIVFSSGLLLSSCNLNTFDEKYNSIEFFVRALFKGVSRRAFTIYLIHQILIGSYLSYMDRSSIGNYELIAFFVILTLLVFLLSNFFEQSKYFMDNKFGSILIVIFIILLMPNIYNVLTSQRANSVSKKTEMFVEVMPTSDTVDYRTVYLGDSLVGSLNPSLRTRDLFLMKYSCPPLLSHLRTETVRLGVEFGRECNDYWRSALGELKGSSAERVVIFFNANWYLDDDINGEPILRTLSGSNPTMLSIAEDVSKITEYVYAKRYDVIIQDVEVLDYKRQFNIFKSGFLDTISVNMKWYKRYWLEGSNFSPIFVSEILCGNVHLEICNMDFYFDSGSWINYDNVHLSRNAADRLVKGLGLD